MHLHPIKTLHYFEFKKGEKLPPGFVNFKFLSFQNFKKGIPAEKYYFRSLSSWNIWNCEHFRLFLKQIIIIVS